MLNLGEVKIPDTVIFQEDIHAWYFTSKNNKMMKKNRTKLNATSIKDNFLRKSSKNKSDIIAIYIHYKINKKELLEVDDSKGFPVSILYLNKPKLIGILLY